MQIQLYNTLSKKVETLIPLEANQVRMYSCGPTVYNLVHIGNLRAFLFPDLLQRVLSTVGGYGVRWVMNITDIDDKTIRDSAIGSRAWKPEMGDQTDDPKGNLRKLTEFYTEKFFHDIERIGIELKDFDTIPRATHYMDEMQNLIRKIFDNGFAYEAEGSIYFDVAKYRQHDEYGKLFKIDFYNFQQGVRIDADEYEREQVQDFVLWKAKKEGEPFWDFEISGKNFPGRPGWHIECSAMGNKILGLPFDIHTGGVDLRFPHHEDEIAQSKAGYGKDTATFWCHNEFLEVEGEKMSKSKNNFYTLNDLIARNLDPKDVRFAMMSAHYSSVYNFTFAGIEAAKKARQRVQDYIYSLHEKNSSGEISADINDLREKIFSELANDLHTPRAQEKIFSFINAHPAQTLDEKTKISLIELFSDLNKIFAVWEISERPVKKLEIPKEILSLAERRFQAKKERNFSLSDELRKKISDAGYVIKDTKDSYEIEKA